MKKTGKRSRVRRAGLDAEDGKTPAAVAQCLALRTLSRQIRGSILVNFLQFFFSDPDRLLPRAGVLLAEREGWDHTYSRASSTLRMLIEGAAVIT